MRAIVEGGDHRIAARPYPGPCRPPTTCCTRDPEVLVPAGNLLDEDALDELENRWRRTKSRSVRR